ncbi:MAG: tRNA pseudouridine(55) synthase TruB [Lachnospiraceae bacterium]|nr:tRNA pseudouridine(55) synthase TruB [Lachnospiraceae bacterium]
MYDGIININKPSGFTSHDVIAKLRGILHFKKIGHTGTLDPLACGVLLLCLGSATRLCDMMPDKGKCYRGRMKFGFETDTEDITGEVLRSCEMKITEEELEKALNSFIGTYNQMPPMYSAKRIEGKRLYEYARSGQEIERKSCEVIIKDIKLEEVIKNEQGFIEEAVIFVECGSGTYIRSLIRDIGYKLNGFACMTELTRTKVGDFSLENSYTLEDIERLVKEGNERTAKMKVDLAFPNLPKLVTVAESDYLLDNGNPIRYDELICEDGRLLSESDIIKNENVYRMYTSTGYFYGLYERKRSNYILFPKKMFVPDIYRRKE